MKGHICDSKLKWKSDQNLVSMRFNSNQNQAEKNQIVGPRCENLEVRVSKITTKTVNASKMRRKRFWTFVVLRFVENLANRWLPLHLVASQTKIFDKIVTSSLRQTLFPSFDFLLYYIFKYSGESSHLWLKNVIFWILFLLAFCQ